MPNFLATVRGTLISVVPVVFAGAKGMETTYNAMLITAPVGDDKHPGTLEIKKWPLEIPAQSQLLDVNIQVKDYILDNGRKGMTISYVGVVEPVKPQHVKQQAQAS